MSISDESLAEYIAEAEEIIGRVSSTLTELEKGGEQKEAISGLYRDMHTLKGSSQLFGFNNIGEVAHTLETTLDPIRKSGCALSPELVDQIYQVLDLVEKSIPSIRDSQSDEVIHAEVQKLLPKLIQSASDIFSGAHPLENDGSSLSESPQSRDQLQPVEPEVDQEIFEPQSGQGNAASEISDPPPVSVPSASVVASPPPVRSTPAPDSNTPKPEANAGSATGSPDSTIRVPVELLDKLMNLAGELVLVRNQVLQYSSQSEDLEFHNLSQSLDVVTSELQEQVMKTRMQPIGNVLSKFQRVVRDVARDLGKKIDLTLKGTETELDKTLLEAIKDPLTHIIRNSCDHGVETPAERSASGKDESGRVLIRAFHEGGQVVVEISDDGRGLDRNKLIDKAISRGLLDRERADRLTDRDVYGLIFEPGFSTAEKVSSVSGRGVGMDVVRTNIEKIGGMVDLDSELGKGTNIRLKIPLTLAIVPAMIVRSGQERFAIPQVKLVELVRVDGGENSPKIEKLQGQPVFRLRGELLPLIPLSQILNSSISDESETDDQQENIVVLNAEGRQFGLLVDEILDTADIVVKPLSQFLKSINLFSGATIMGDGSVALILDVMGITKVAKMATDSEARDSLDEALNDRNSMATETQDFLLVRVNAPGRYAVPLCLVNRLEEFKPSEIEFSGDQKVVRYRNSILPLISVNKVLGFDQVDSNQPEQTEDGKEVPIPVVVIPKRGKLFGVEVNEILDVLEINSNVDDSITDRFGIHGNLVYDEEVIVVIDVLAVLDRAIDEMISRGGSTNLPTEDAAQLNNGDGANGKSNSNSSKTPLSVFYAEDAPFFRKQVSRILTRAGHRVHMAEDGESALKQLESAPEGKYNVILSDIEMPKMTGFELAEKIQQNDRLRGIPLVALTTRFKDRDIELGRQVGFTRYLEKLNEEKLLQVLEELSQSQSINPERKRA